MSRIEHSYDNCEINCNSQEHGQNLRKFIYLFVRKALPKLRKLQKLQFFLKTAKFTVIRKSMDKIYEIYLLGCKEDPSKVTKISLFQCAI